MYLLPSGKGNNAKEEDHLEDDGHVVANGEVGGKASKRIGLRRALLYYLHVSPRECHIIAYELPLLIKALFRS